MRFYLAWVGIEGSFQILYSGFASSFQGRSTCGFDIPEWEFKCSFDPVTAMSNVNQEVHWTTLSSGKNLQSPTPVIPFEQVLDGNVSLNVNSLPLRDPDNFVAGEIHNHYEEWHHVLNEVEDSGLPCDRIRHWLKDGVDAREFFKPYKGKFKGKMYDSAEPPETFFPNSSTCIGFESFIAEKLEEGIRNGAISLLGKVGECAMPRVIMPLTVEPTKPRLCHDERFLNLWIEQTPFKMETLRDIHRIVGKGAKMVALDEKSGYNQVKLSNECRGYFGIQFGGYVMQYNTLPFGWRASPYVYQTIGMVPTVYLRKKGICTTQYIDDRFGVENINQITGQIVCGIAVTGYALLELLTRLGYFFALHKSYLDGITSLKYLGFIVDSDRLAYILPVDKKETFKCLRTSILQLREIDLKTLQRFLGKCISMALAVPGVKLYTREVAKAISFCTNKSGKVAMYPKLFAEIEHWGFLDEWDGHMSWRSECHKQLILATDASMYKYGAVVLSGEHSGRQFSDFWDKNDDRSINQKETDALLRALESMAPQIKDTRVDVLTDSKVLVDVWGNQGGKCRALNDLIKSIFTLVFSLNVELNLFHVPSSQNPADAPSRSLNMSDVMLSRSSWSSVEKQFGPHTVDLMALDSNTMISRHFTPGPSPKTSGINVFAQDITKEGNPYVFLHIQ